MAASAAAPPAAPQPATEAPALDPETETDTPLEPAPERAARTRQRIVVTGGGGFIGGQVVRILAGRGDDVIVPVRDSRRAQHVAAFGATVVEDDLSDVARLSQLLRDADAVIHAAGSYRVGIGKTERGAMWDANVGTTTRILDAAEAAGTKRTVYVSTVNIFGNTHGRVVDESYRRDPRQGFLSWYDETKLGAHEVAEQRAKDGAPIVFVLPSQVYGPGDHTAIGEQLRLAHDGRLRYVALGDVGLGFVHVDDLATGIVAALDRGTPGEEYVLTGPRTTLDEAISIAARLGGHKPPALRVPTGLLRLMRPIGGLIGQPNLGEVISAAAGVTYWATADKASRDLAFAPRGIDEGFADMFAPGSFDV